MPVQQSIDGRANRNADARATGWEEDFHSAEATANRTAVSSSSSQKGFVKKADAPAFNAVERTRGSVFPVKMMTRVEGEIWRSCDCTSRPLICGMQTSIKATAGRWSRAYRRNSSQSLNVSACRLADERSRRSPFSTDGSSSSKQTIKAVGLGKVPNYRLRSPRNAMGLWS
jgi:hypothetical protein